MIEPETGIQVPIDDDDALAAAMARMVKDDHHEYAPEAIRQRAQERFSEATFVKASTAFYESALA